jgi:hypothetical protein
MLDFIHQAKALTEEVTYPYEFSVCTLVTRKEEYGQMMGSFVSRGFTRDCCEYLYIDNSEGCRYDAFSGLNLFLQQAQGKYIILCHQDVLLQDHGKDDLIQCIKQMDRVDPHWGVLGNAGGVNLKWLARHITSLSGERHVETLLPLRVMSVDENWMVVRKDANLALSRDLRGFHMYGSDICLIADTLGYRSYVIDFNLLHKSEGNADASFYKLRGDLINKYRRAFRSRFILTTITRFYISGCNWASLVWNTRLGLFLARQYYKFFTKKTDYLGLP